MGWTGVHRATGRIVGLVHAGSTGQWAGRDGQHRMHAACGGGGEEQQDELEEQSRKKKKASFSFRSAWSCSAAALRHLPVLLGSCVKWPPSECCNLSVMPWILSTKLLRAWAWLWASDSPPPPPVLHCGISSAMLLMFGMEPNYHSRARRERKRVRNVLQLLSCLSPCSLARPRHDSGNG